MVSIQVPLERHFYSIRPNTSDDEEGESWIAETWGLVKPTCWADIEAEYRVIILADAGAGKTYETKERARIAQTQGRIAFYIRIEDINDHFQDAFEVGNSKQYEAWLVSQDEAWFFLDSVDEAKLNHWRDFEKAIRYFGRRIYPACHRAHVVITSRPYAWRFRADKELVDKWLPFTRTHQQDSSDISDSSDLTTVENIHVDEDDSVSVYGLRPLGVQDIRLFAMHLGASNIDSLVAEIEKANLLEMASRPFDLEGLLAKWKADGALGGRRESLRHIIDNRLTEIDPDRNHRQSLNHEKALMGARQLAAAVTLSGNAGILVPDVTHEKTGIDAEEVLADWSPKEVRALLERGIFNDILFGSVRFRHREIRELLTADWLHSLIRKKGSRGQIESLLFREQYGEQVITPRLRPILPWLILSDESIRARTLTLCAEVAIEGGDAACLPLQVRREILKNIVSRIAADEDDHSVRHNSAIWQIAQQDLSNDTYQLIEAHIDNDDAIFFLARLVWQGKMSDCLSPLFSVAIDSSRKLYQRIVSARAVSSVGTHEQLKLLWKTINNKAAAIPYRLLAELVEHAAIDDHTLDLLLISLDRLPPYEKFEATGLDEALHQFIDRFAELPDSERSLLLKKLCVGFNRFLSKEPYHERRECRVSKEFVWMMGPANHAVDILVAARASACFDASIISILLKIPVLRHWIGNQFNEYKTKLQELIPVWTEFNDFLFWRSIDEARAVYSEQGKRLTDDWPVQWLGHYWRFEADSFARVADYVRTKHSEDDQLVALSLAFRIYTQAEQPAKWRTILHKSVKGSAVLDESLKLRFHPPVSEACIRLEKEELDRKQAREKARQEQVHSRSQWIARLRDNPEVVRNPPGLTPGEWTYDQYWLLQEMEAVDYRASARGRGADWRVLVKEFSEGVAYAFRDAAMKHWRAFRPSLRSEGVDTTSIPSNLVFGLVGLEFESSESDRFPEKLIESEITHALRYIVYEINGFPSWLEDMYKEHQEAVIEFVWRELEWELDNTSPETPEHYILHDIVFHAPWLHVALAPLLQQWIRNNPYAPLVVLDYCLQILQKTEVPPNWFAELARSKVVVSESKERPQWYAIWVDAEPKTGITAVATWLSSMENDAALLAAQQFVTHLVGRGPRQQGRVRFRNFETVAYLKDLYLLMHQYIRIEDDNVRGGKGVYTPDLRDDAQSARGDLLNLLTEIPGKETYLTLQVLARFHPHLIHRSWMLKLARNRAERDADLDPWSARQIYEYSSSLEREPMSHRQLFDVGVSQLIDFKEWLECGNDSLARTYRRIDDETEMRQVVAHRLSDYANGRYTCAQENPLANEQRPDIWLQHHRVASPVPIELKLLDKGWSGPKLCERLRNQLAGDYLREETAGCGIFLLIWQGKQPGRRWQIEGERVGVSGLQSALKDYWRKISYQFSNVLDINVIVVDLTLREEKSSKP